MSSLGPARSARLCKDPLPRQELRQLPGWLRRHVLAAAGVVDRKS